MYRLSAAGAGSALSVKVLATVVAVGATAGVAGLGTYATFDSTTSADLPTDSGVVSIALGATGAVTNRLDITAADVVPGDTIQRAFDLTGASTDPVSALTLTTTAPTSSVLNTDATDGLQMVLSSCAQPWTEAGPPYTYTCGAAGGAKTIIASRAVIGSGLDLLAGAAAASVTLASASTGTDHLRVTLTLPATAGNTFQNRASTIRFAFTATQRTAGSE